MTVAGKILSTGRQSPRPIVGLAEIADAFDVFLIDQWGVLHDGSTTYPGAAHSLDALTALGKRVVIITNSSKTNAVNQDRLASRFGINRDRYNLLISSAELLRDALETGQVPGLANTGIRVFCVADGLDHMLLADRTLTLVDTPEEADCVALLSVAPGEGITEHQDWLDRALCRNLPMVSPSADALSVSLRGIVEGLASIVRSYRAAGGNCINFGKPEAMVYEAALSETGAIPPERVLAIGDQLESDVCGARRHGFASLLVLTGAGAPRVGTSNTVDACERLAGAAFAADLCPDYVSSSLVFDVSSRSTSR